MAWRDQVAGRSKLREADNRISARSAMLTCVRHRALISVNLVREFVRLHHGDRSEIIWLPEHIEAFMSVGPLEMQRALMLRLHTGQRQTDNLGLDWSAFDGEYIMLR